MEPSRVWEKIETYIRFRGKAGVRKLRQRSKLDEATKRSLKDVDLLQQDIRLLENLHVDPNTRNIPRQEKWLTLLKMQRELKE